MRRDQTPLSLNSCSLLCVHFGLLVTPAHEAERHDYEPQPATADGVQ